MRIERVMEKPKNLRIKTWFKICSESIICVFQEPDLNEYFGLWLQKNPRVRRKFVFLNVGWQCQRKGTQYHRELHDISTNSSRSSIKFIKYQAENYTHEDESKIINKIIKQECLRQGLVVDIEHQMIETF